MDALKAIESRKSTRDYENKAVEVEKIEAILRAANNAPKAGEFHITVVLNAPVLHEINDKAHECMKNSGNDFLMERAALPGYRPMYGAPVLIVFSASQENPYSLANVSNAVTSATIAATAMGLGSCYVVTPILALNADVSLAEKIGIPKGLKPMCCVLIGYSGKEKFAAAKQQQTNNINYYK